MKQSENIAMFLKFLREAEQDCNVAASQERDADLAVQDVLHRLELQDDGYHDSAKLALALREIRRERRAARDKHMILEPIARWCQKNQPFVKQLELLLGEVRKLERSQENRHYNDRTDIISKTLVDIKKEQPEAAPSRITG